MKIFSTWIAPFRDQVDDESRRRWRRDPLSHPEIAAMSPRERADLPLSPVCLSRFEEECQV